MTWRTFLSHARARILLWLGTRDLARCRRYEVRIEAMQARAQARVSRAQAILDRLRPSGPPCPAGDLLYGSKAIAAHLGVTKAVAVHLIRSGAIPWFALAGVACARRSTLAAHFAGLEAGR